ncbi:hypothetical protein, partial [Photorhabdus laumondii]|uniref:hypothetical protein n=1 Tax=Photorhabdus laumondii TaxID=2218628 RepID=UPI001EE3B3D0
ASMGFQYVLATNVHIDTPSRYFLNFHFLQSRKRLQNIELLIAANDTKTVKLISNKNTVLFFS